MVIYVYENNDTYYFVEYDTTNQSFGEKIYHSLQGATEFYICNEENGYFYFKFKQDNTYLAYCELEPDAVEVELMPFERKGEMLLSKYGNIFLLDKNQNTIKRVKNSVYMNDNKEIVLLSPMYSQGRNPFGCGYRTRNLYQDQEELALSVLSRDTDYDLFLVNSNLQVSQNIREKGSFYPLNKVEGVKEYLDACFPYIKEAAINEEGDIWMIPVYINMPMLLYQDEMCSKYGCSTVQDLTYEEFCTWVSHLKANDSASELYYINSSSIVNELIRQYCIEYTKFEIPQFRGFAETVRNSLNYLNGNQEDNDVAQQVLNHQREV